MGQLLLGHQWKVLDASVIVQDQQLVRFALKSTAGMADFIGHDHVQMLRLHLLLGVGQQLLSFSGKAHQHAIALALAKFGEDIGIAD